MIYALLLFWAASAVIVAAEEKIVRLAVYLGIFSLISSACLMFFGAPDVAMAEAVVSAFSTVVFIVCFEKYHGRAEDPAIADASNRSGMIAPLLFVSALAAVFIFFMPGPPPAGGLKDRYLSSFASDVGGLNAVTAIYLGYRMYDTLFEALMLLCSIAAILHLSRHARASAEGGRPSGVAGSEIAGFTVRIIGPVLLLFGAYLVANGSVSPGGGFHGGVAVASFFICRYMVHDIYDIPVKKVITAEKLIYAGIVFFAADFIIMEARVFLHMSKEMYLTAMNALIAVKVACGFFVMFYRFVALERN